METHEPIQWLAIYKDGETLPQHNGERENKYIDIDRARLAVFALRRGDRMLLAVHFDHPAQRLIYRRRVFMRQGGETEDKQIFHLVGWQRSISAGETVQAICVMNDDGAIDLIGRWRDEHLLFESVHYLPCEEEECERPSN